jgi:hypothetical protein
MNGEDRPGAASTQRSMQQGRTHRGQIVRASDRAIEALRLHGGVATLVALVEIGGRITLTAGDDEQLVARLVEAER